VDAYAKLARQMDTYPLGAPRSPRLLEILHELFGPEEAELALSLSFQPLALSRLAQETGRGEEEIRPLLESMAGKGLLYARLTAREAYYCLLPVFPGIFELQFMTGQRGPVKTRLARLFEDYYVEGLGQAFTETETRFARVIPVEKQVPVSMEIFPFERASELISDEGDFALATCYCRHEKDLLGQACEAPRDVCLLFGPFARFAVERGFAARADLARVRDALERSEEAGLVHVSDNVSDRINFMCNCCGCCCGFLRTITELGQANVVAASRFVARLDESRCTLCGACLEVCQVKALSLTNDELEFEPERCLGCGLCVHHCPSGALTLEGRQDYLAPHRDRRELGAAMLRERGLIR